MNKDENLLSPGKKIKLQLTENGKSEEVTVRRLEKNPCAGIMDMETKKFTKVQYRLFYTRRDRTKGHVDVYLDCANE